MNSCPRPEQLVVFLADQMEPEARGRLIRHLDDCSACRRKLDQLTDYREFQTRLKRPGPASVDTSLHLLDFELRKVFSVKPPRAEEFPEVPGYRIVGEVGRGGMSIVFKAIQEELNRPVALKMILAGKHAQQEERLRFRREAESVAQLVHPNIVQIYEIGEVEGCPYLALEFVDGETLRQQVQDRPMSPRDAADLIHRLALAMHFAHERGVVHRDLKSANVLIDASGEPKITDFGLAKLHRAEDHLTATGRILGTPAYMAPEQARGESRRVGPAADIYSLGIVLYEALTGHLPFRGANDWDTLHQVVHSEPMAPRSLNVQVPRDLETICMKCLNKDPAKRYGSMRDLAEDLSRWLVGQPISARPSSRWERGVRWCRRNPILAGLLALIFFVLAVGTVISTLFAIEAQLERSRAETALERSVRQLYLSRIAMAEHSWRRNQVAHTLQLLDECPERLRHWEWYYLKRRCHQEVLTIPCQTSSGNGFASHPSRPLLVVAAGPTTEIWDTAVGKRVSVVEMPSPSVSAVFSNRGRYAAVICHDGTVAYWPVDAPDKITSITGPNDAAQALALDEERMRLVTGDADGDVLLWDLRRKRVIRRLRCRGLIRRLAFDRQGRWVAIASGDSNSGGEFALLDATGATQIRRVEERRLFTGVSFDESGQRIAVASRHIDNRVGHEGRNGQIVILDTATGNELHCFTCQRFLTAVAFRPLTNQLVAAVGTTIVLYDLDTSRIVTTIRGHLRLIHDIAIGCDGKHVACACGNRPIRVWHLEADQEAEVLPFPDELIYNSVAFQGDRLVAAAGVSGRFYVFDLQSDQIILTGEHAGPWRGVVDLALSPNGTVLATASRGTEVKVWNVQSGRALRQLKEPGMASVVFSRDGRQLAACGAGGNVHVWSTGTWRKLCTLRHRDRQLFSLDFSPNGSRLVAAGQDGPPAVWDLATGKLLMQLTPCQAAVDDVAFSPSGQLIVAGLDDGTAQVYDANTGRQLAILRGHTHKVTGVAFTPDGKRLATTSDDCTLRLWDVDTGQQIVVFDVHQGGTTAAAFSASGTLLVTASWDGTIRLWDGTPLSPSAQPRLRHRRKFHGRTRR